MHLKIKTISKARPLYCSNRHCVLTGINYHGCFGKIHSGIIKVYNKITIQNKKKLCLSYDYQKKAPSFIPILVFSVAVKFKGDYLCRVISYVITT